MPEEFRVADNDLNIERERELLLLEQERARAISGQYEFPASPAGPDWLGSIDPASLSETGQAQAQNYFQENNARLRSRQGVLEDYIDWAPLVGGLQTLAAAGGAAIGGLGAAAGEMAATPYLGPLALPLGIVAGSAGMTKGREWAEKAFVSGAEALGVMPPEIAEEERKHLDPTLLEYGLNAVVPIAARGLNYFGGQSKPVVQGENAAIAAKEPGGIAKQLGDGSVYANSTIHELQRPKFDNGSGQRLSKEQIFTTPKGPNEPSLYDRSMEGIDPSSVTENQLPRFKENIDNIVGSSENPNSLVGQKERLVQAADDVTESLGRGRPGESTLARIRDLDREITAQKGNSQLVDPNFNQPQYEAIQIKIGELQNERRQLNEMMNEYTNTRLPNQKDTYFKINQDISSSIGFRDLTDKLIQSKYGPTSPAKEITSTLEATQTGGISQRLNQMVDAVIPGDEVGARAARNTQKQALSGNYALSQMRIAADIRNGKMPLVSRTWAEVKQNPQMLAVLATLAINQGIIPGAQGTPDMVSALTQLPEPVQENVYKAVGRLNPQVMQPSYGGYTSAFNGKIDDPREQLLHAASVSSEGLDLSAEAFKMGPLFADGTLVPTELQKQNSIAPPTVQTLPQWDTSSLLSILGESEQAPQIPQEEGSTTLDSMLRIRDRGQSLVDPVEHGY